MSAPILSCRDVRARVQRARTELDQVEQQLAVRWQPWRARIDRHRTSLLIGGGLIGGLALATVAPKRWARVGAALFGGSAWLARSGIGTAVFAALWTNILNSSVATHRRAAGRPAVDDVHPVPPSVRR
jgi:hypothetical protein